MTNSLTPEQLAQEGKAAYAREEYLQAAQAFEAAQAGYTARGSVLPAAEMANNRSVALLQEGDAEGARAAAGKTAETFAQAGDTHRQAMALGNQAAALAALGRKEEAESLYWESARLFQQIGETELRASVMQSISRLQLRAGRPLEAVASMQAGLDQVEKPSLSQRILRKLLQVPFKLLKRS